MITSFPFFAAMFFARLVMAVVLCFIYYIVGFMRVSSTRLRRPTQLTIVSLKRARVTLSTAGDAKTFQYTFSLSQAAPPGAYHRLPEEGEGDLQRRGGGVPQLATRGSRPRRGARDTRRRRAAADAAERG